VSFQSRKASGRGHLPGGLPLVLLLGLQVRSRFRFAAHAYPFSRRAFYHKDILPSNRPEEGRDRPTGKQQSRYFLWLFLNLAVSFRPGSKQSLSPELKASSTEHTSCTCQRMRALFIPGNSDNIVSHGVDGHHLRTCRTDPLQEPVAPFLLGYANPMGVTMVIVVITPTAVCSIEVRNGEANPHHIRPGSVTIGYLSSGH